MTGTLSHLCESYGRTIVIVPNKSLVKQTEEDYLNLGLDVGVYFGDRKDFGKTHTICTWQSLDRIMKNDKSGTGTFTMHEFVQDVVAVIVDEAHGARANELKELMCGPLSHIPIRWGLTGTVPKEEEQIFSILASIGPVVNTLSAKELMDEGVLSQCHIHILQMIDTVQYTSFPEEYKYLTTDKNRLDWISQLTLDIAKSGNTLILINRIETGEELEKLIPGAIFVSGGTSLEDRKETYDDIATATNNIIIATYGVAAVGINIPRIFNLILFEAGKSFIRTIQSIGRGIRKAADKDEVTIYDIGSTCKFSAKHVTERKKTYKAAQYPFDVTKIDYQSQLATGKIQFSKKA
jgi:superfamily II DNA or RNA helicase